MKDNQIIILDEQTGRQLPGRRYGDGLHQSLEAKENLEIQAENQTLASITYQNYFKLYDKICGCTGTAQTEAEEIFEIYKLPVISIPTNKKMIRLDYNDLIFRTQKEKDQLSNPVWHIHNGKPPKEKIVMPFTMLLNIVGSSNAKTKDVLWKFKKKFHNEIEPKEHKILDELTD